MKHRFLNATITAVLEDLLPMRDLWSIIICLTNSSVSSRASTMPPLSELSGESLTIVARTLNLHPLLRVTKTGEANRALHLTNQLVASGLIVRNSSSCFATLSRPLALGCVPSPAKSAGS